MSYIIVGLLCLIVGVLISGTIYALYGGLKTDVAVLKAHAANDYSELHNRLSALEAAAKLP